MNFQRTRNLRRRASKHLTARNVALGAVGVGAAGAVASVAAGIGLAMGVRAVWNKLTMADIRGQSVLITGASRGLGFALAQEFARQRCRVAICARNQDELDA